MSWGDRAKAARKRLGWTQAQAGKFCGVDYVTIGRWERGEVEPSRPTRRLIALMELCELGGDGLVRLAAIFRAAKLIASA